MLINKLKEKDKDIYALFENEITLPLHTKLTDEDVEYVIETFRKCVSEV